MKPVADRRRFLSLMGFLLVMILPVIVPVWFLDRLLQESEVQEARRQESELDMAIRTPLFQADPREIFCRTFNSLFERLERSGFSENSISLLPNVFPEFLKVQVCPFTKDGILTPPPWVEPFSRYSYQKLWKDLLGNGTDGSRIKIYQKLFGGQFLLDDACFSEGTLYEVAPGSTNGGFIWRRSTDNSGLLFFIPEFPTTFRSLVSRSEVQTRRGIPLCLFDPLSDEHVTFDPSWEGSEKAIKAAAFKGGGTYLEEDLLCRVIQHPEGFWAMAWKPIEPGWEWKARLGVWCLCLGATILLSFWWLRFGISPIEQLRISPRILALFIVAVVVPATLLAGLGVSSFRGHSSVLEREIFETAAEKLHALDNAFRKRQESLLEFFRRIRDHPHARSGNRAGFEGISRVLRARKLIDRGETRDVDGKVIGSLDRGTTLIENMGFFARNVLRRYIFREVPRPTDPIERLAIEILMSPRIGFFRIFDSPDAILNIQMGKKTQLLFWDVFPPVERQPVAFIGVTQRVLWNLDRFLQTHLPPDVLAFTQENRSWTRSEPRKPELKALVAQSILARRTVRRVYQDGNSTLMATAYPSTVLEGLCFLTTSDLSPVFKKVDRLRTFFALAAFLTLLMAVFFSRILAHSIISPIRELEKGIEALDNQRLGFRIPDLGNDELGRLGTAFNELLAELRELYLARRIQKNLLPQTPPEIPDYEFALHSQSVSDLRGDFVDAMKMKDGRITLVMGDVAGRGISSSLLTSMAKVVCHFNAARCGGVEDLFQRFTMIMEGALQKRKSMSLVVGILDSAKNSLEWSSAGAPFPLHRFPDGTVSFMEMRRYPLGTRKRDPLKVERIRLEPGESVLFYTNGLVEALDHAGNPFGFDRLRQSFERFGSRPAAEASARILTEFQGHVSEGMFTDDVSFLILRRKPSTRTGNDGGEER